MITEGDGREVGRERVRLPAWMLRTRSSSRWLARHAPAPVRRQLLTLLRLVNDARKRAGFAAVPTKVLSLRRRIVRPFADDRTKAALPEGVR